MKKAVVFFLSCAMMTSMLAGCGGESSDSTGGSADSAEEQKVSGTLSIAVVEDRVKYYEPVAEAFMEEYPDVEVELSVSPDFTAMNQAAQAAHQAGDDFDIITVNHVDTMTFQKAGMLYPMSELAERDGVDFDSLFM